MSPPGVKKKRPKSFSHHTSLAFLFFSSYFSFLQRKRTTKDNMLRNILFYLSLFLSTATNVNAFSVAGARLSRTTPSTGTQLSVSTTTHFILDTECLLEAEYCVPSEQQQRHAKSLSIVRQQQAAWTDLPRHSSGSESSVDLELQLGRTAMVIGLLLLVSEIMTGQS